MFDKRALAPQSLASVGKGLSNRTNKVMPSKPSCELHRALICIKENVPFLYWMHQQKIEDIISKDNCRCNKIEAGKVRYWNIGGGDRAVTFGDNHAIYFMRGEIFSIGKSSQTLQKPVTVFDSYTRSTCTFSQKMI